MASVVLLALSLALTATAQAREFPGWSVEESILGPSETKAFSFTSTAATKLEVPKLLTVTAPSEKCTLTGSIAGGELEAPGRAEGVTMKCTGVTVEKAAACQVHSPGQPAGTVVTNTLLGTLAWLEKTGSQAGLILKPATGTEVARIVVTECALEGTNAVVGEVIAKFTPVEKEATSAELSLPSPSITHWWNNEETSKEQGISGLLFGARTATLISAFKGGLTEVQNFGVRGKGNTRLCEEPPKVEGGRLRCPAGKAYEGPIEATLLNGPANLSTFNGVGTETSKIRCAGSVLKGNFLKTGESKVGEGINSFVFENAGTGKCTQFFGMVQGPEVVVAIQGLPYAQSFFQYNPVVGGQTGTFTMAKKKVGGVEIAIEMNVTIEGKPPCSYKLGRTAGEVTNGPLAGPTKWKLNVPWPLSEGNAECPAKIQWPNLEWELKRTGLVAGPLFLAPR